MNKTIGDSTIPTVGFIHLSYFVIGISSFLNASLTIFP